MIDGTVTDTVGRPIADARVLVRPGSLVVPTDSAGRFRMDARPGTSLLHVQSVGYIPADFVVHLQPDSTVHVTVQLVPSQFRLDTVIVSGVPEVTGLQINGFYERLRDRQRGAGTASFVTPEEIERRHPQRITDLLVALPGVHVQWVRNIAIPYGRQLGCIMNIWIDGSNVDIYQLNATGRLPPRGAPEGLDEFLPVSQVAAVEVYQTPSEVPPQFDNVKAACGTIVIWTGGRR